MAVKKRKAAGWKKEWYSVIATKDFEEKEIGLVPADEDTKLLSRVVKVPLKHFTNNLNHQFIDLFFRIVDVKGKTAYTRLEGFELLREYMKRHIRRRRSAIRAILELDLKEGKKIRVTAYAITKARTDTNKQQDVRKIMMAVLKDKALSMTFEEFIKKSIYGELSSEIYNSIKKIVPIRKVEIYKVKSIEG
ncbi:MAG: 30S ribosomal protein S3ae [archaeon]